MPFIIIPVFYLSIYARARAGPGGTWAEKWCHRPSADVPVAALGHPRLDIYGFFEDPKRHRKSEDFSNPPKSTKMALSIDPGASKARLLIKKLDFWPPFGIDFSFFFSKMAKV